MIPHCWSYWKCLTVPCLLHKKVHYIYLFIFIPITKKKHKQQEKQEKQKGSAKKQARNKNGKYLYVRRRKILLYIILLFSNSDFNVVAVQLRNIQFLHSNTILHFPSKCNDTFIRWKKQQQTHNQPPNLTMKIIQFSFSLFFYFHFHFIFFYYFRFYFLPVNFFFNFFASFNCTLCILKLWYGIKNNHTYISVYIERERYVHKKYKKTKMKLSTRRATTTTTRRKKRNYYMRYLSRKANKYCTKQTTA